MSEPNLDRELERLLGATRAGTAPDADARARVRAALTVSLAGAGVAGGRVAPRLGQAAKLWLLTAFAVALLAGVALWGRARSSPPAVAPTRTLPAASLEAAAPSRASAPPPSVASDAVAAPRASAEAPRPTSARPRGSSKAEEPADELALVSSMQLALRSGNAAQALALANEHARRFPRGALTQEREGARAIARCQLAEPAARSAIQSSFDAHYAGSPYAARVKAACAR